jgi:hypothetical protein
VYGGFTLYAGTFQSASTSTMVSYSVLARQNQRDGPTTPYAQRLPAIRFREHELRPKAGFMLWRLLRPKARLPPNDRESGFGLGLRPRLALLPGSSCLSFRRLRSLRILALSASTAAGSASVRFRSGLVRVDTGSQLHISTGFPQRIRIALFPLRSPLLRESH